MSLKPTFVSLVAIALAPIYLECCLRFLRKTSVRKLILVVFALGPSLAFAAPIKSTKELILERKHCKESEDQTVTCDYFAGSDFHLTIAGVGLADAAVTFVSSREDGDFYGTFGIGHGCVIVKRGRTGLDPKAGWGPGSMVDYAFVSPKSGKVYGSWQECKDGL